VGADGDLYIGQSKNYFYGSLTKFNLQKQYLQKCRRHIGSGPSEYKVLGTGVNQLFVSQQKSVYFFLEEPAKRFLYILKNKF
jgi:hypothetical protein